MLYYFHFDQNLNFYLWNASSYYRKIFFDFENFLEHLKYLDLLLSCIQNLRYCFLDFFLVKILFYWLSILWYNSHNFINRIGRMT